MQLLHTCNDQTIIFLLFLILHCRCATVECEIRATCTSANSATGKKKQRLFKATIAGIFCDSMLLNKIHFSLRRGSENLGAMAKFELLVLLFLLGHFMYLHIYRSNRTFVSCVCTKINGQNIVGSL